jgi:hypothetical protein
MGFKMRRGLTAVLILLFWLGPLAGALAADDDARLPACCRRHGQHHCDMSEQDALALAASASGAVFAAPTRCPSFPRYVATLVAPMHAVPAAPAGVPVLAARPRTQFASSASVRNISILLQEGRGPPVSILL